MTFIASDLHLAGISSEARPRLSPPAREVMRPLPTKSSDGLRSTTPGQIAINTSLSEGCNVLWEDETSWIERAKRGEEAAFAAIYDRYEKQIYALVYRLMGNPDDAFDIAQDVFIKAFKAIDKTQPDLNLSAWLHRIASNACLDVLRRRKIVRWLPWDPAVHTNLTPAGDYDEPEQHLIRNETKEQVQAVLNKMSSKYRLCLVLREYQDLSCEEIGEIMNLSRAAVKSTLFRAREQFREIYEEFQSQNWAGVGSASNAQYTASPSNSKSASRKGGRR